MDSNNSIHIISVVFVVAFLTTSVYAQSTNSYETETPCDSDERASSCALQLQAVTDLVLQQQHKIEALEAKNSDFVSFTAYLSATYTAIQDNRPVVFDNVISNVGQAFDTSTGRFTCPRHGLYLFIINVYVIANDQAYVVLVKNEDEVARATTTGDDTFDHGANSVTLECNQGDEVWIKGTEPGNLYSHARARRSTFTGVALHYF